MQTPLRILIYLTVVYGFLFSGVFAFGKSGMVPDFPHGDVFPWQGFTGLGNEEIHSVPEPGGIGLVAFLVVLLAMQRQRG